jgi:hypothetical protein
MQKQRTRRQPSPLFETELSVLVRTAYGAFTQFTRPQEVGSGGG